MLRLTFALVAACVAASPAVAQLDDLDRAPINYKTAQTNNVVADLQKKHSNAEIGSIDSLSRHE